MVCGQQAYKDMPVSLHFILNALVWGNAQLLYPRHNLIFEGVE